MLPCMLSCVLCVVLYVVLYVVLNVVLCCVVLHRIALHCAALHRVALHCAALCCVVECVVVCCSPKAMAGVVLHAGKCKPGGLCVEVRVVCSVLRTWYGWGYTPCRPGDNRGRAIFHNQSGFLAGCATSTARKVHSTAQHSIAQHSTAQHSTLQYSTP